MHITEKPITPCSVVCFLYVKKKRNQVVSPKKASLIWDSRNKRLSRVDQPLRNPLCRGEIHFSFSKTYTKRVLTIRSKVLQKQLVKAMGRFTKDNHLSRLKDWNHSGFALVGGKTMLLPNSVE
ncbi:hypothetical protein TNCV_975821 [Trichonephila clavipes]|nr:hypothetical protein TNCV_975821 [Trichonephila clavipes]